MANPQTSYFPLTGDLVIDAETHGFYWRLDASKTIDYSISNGFNSEYWNSPSTVVLYMGTALEWISHYAVVYGKEELLNLWQL
jgi:hypothetical protein